MALLYGMEHTNHDSDDPKFLGKNIFTNAFPLSLANYIDREKKLPIPVVSATVTDDGAMPLGDFPTLGGGVGRDMLIMGQGCRLRHSKRRNVHFNGHLRLNVLFTAPRDGAGARIGRPSPHAPPRSAPQRPETGRLPFRRRAS